MGYTLWKVLEASQLPRILNRSETKKKNCEFCFATLLVHLHFLAITSQNPKQKWDKKKIASSVLLLYWYIFISWPSLPRILNRSETKKKIARSVLLLYWYILISWPSRRLSSCTFFRVCYNKVLLLFIIWILY